MATKPPKHEQANDRRNFFEPEQIPFEKKTGPAQIRIQDICRPGLIRYHNSKRTRHTTNFEFNMNQGTTSSMNPVDKVSQG